jgi:hypothetical protein
MPSHDWFSIIRPGDTDIEPGRQISQPLHDVAADGLVRRGRMFWSCQNRPRSGISLIRHSATFRHGEVVIGGAVCRAALSSEIDRGGVVARKYLVSYLLTRAVDAIHFLSTSTLIEQNHGKIGSRQPPTLSMQGFYLSIPQGVLTWFFASLSQVDQPLADRTSLNKCSICEWLVVGQTKYSFMFPIMNQESQAPQRSKVCWVEILAELLLVSISLIAR